MFVNMQSFPGKYKLPEFPLFQTIYCVQFAISKQIETERDMPFSYFIHRADNDAFHCSKNILRQT